MAIHIIIMYLLSPVKCSCLFCSVLFYVYPYSWLLLYSILNRLLKLSHSPNRKLNCNTIIMIEIEDQLMGVVHESNKIEEINFREVKTIREIREIYYPRIKPAIRYCMYF